MNIFMNHDDELNEKIKQAIEDILVDIVPQTEGIASRPSTDEEFDNERRRHLTD